jgi:group II intron reverse transcriptase/maturase
MAQLAGRVSDRHMQKLIRSLLRCGVLQDGVVSGSESGAAQGSPISPLLCNIALHVLDAEWTRAGSGVLVRYADDFVVLCPTRERAEQALARVQAILEPLGLKLNPDKTRIVCLTEGSEGFDFLGFHLRKVESRRWPGHWYLQRWPSRRAMASIREKIREATQPRYASLPMPVVVTRLNRKLRGWANYFGYGNSRRMFSSVDFYVNLRLMILTRRKHGLTRKRRRRVDGSSLQDLGVYRLTGTVRPYGPAHA